MYRAFTEHGVQEVGDYYEGLLAALMVEAELSLDGLSKSFAVGVARSEEDFVEVSPVGGDEYLIWSDRLFPAKSWWRRLRERHHIEQIVTGREAAIGVLKTYAGSQSPAVRAELR